MDFSVLGTGRHATADEVAAVVLFLASDDASWVNGAEIRVDGGLTAALSTGAVVFPLAVSDCRRDDQTFEVAGRAAAFLVKT